MKVDMLPGGDRLVPQKLSARQTPHATIEPITACNIRCRFCYAIEHPMVKPLEEVKDEIDLACAKRNLDTISLLGGEPTLHPDLVEMVRYVKAKGLVCQVLTNGVRFLYRHDIDLLRALVDAGVDRFLVHIDSGQEHVHDDIDEAREALFSLLDEHRVFYGLSLTLYADDERDLPRILAEYSPHPYFDGVLVTLAMDFEHAFVAEHQRTQEPDFGEVVGALKNEMHIEPAAYIPSSLDDDEVCWAMYFYWVNVETGATFALSPELNQWMKWLYRKLRGREFFAETLSPRTKALSFAAAAAAEVVLHPSRIPELARLLRGARGTRNLRFNYVVIQQAPRMNTEHGKVQICWQCPDAVIRHGRLTPVCLAGRINPLGEGAPTAPREVVETVFAHLGEPPPDFG
jgi:hypothetical protein